MSTASLAEMLEDFRKQFIRASLDRLREMDTAIDRASSTGSPDPVRELSRHFHGLSGAGGTYGFASVSTDGAAGEVSCEAVLAAARPPASAEIGRWRELVQSIRAELETGGNGTAWMPASARPAPVADVLVVDDDPDVRRMLSRVCESEGFTVRTAGSLAETRRHLDSVLPDVLLLDLSLPDGPGLQLVEELRSRPGGETVAVLVVSGLGGFDDRVEAIHCGADGCFPKPIDVEAMLRRMHHLIDRNRTTPSRILSVEDEPEQAALIRAVLESAGYEVRICRGSQEFAGDLDSFRPNLVLMDARLPDTSGYELARYIRQEERHAALPVIFLTAEALTSHRIDALRAGGDDYLTKPVIPSLLLSVVGARLERARFLEMLLLRDGLTRLLTHTAFFENVRGEVGRLLEQRDPKASLVLIDVDRFQGINREHGHPAGDRVLASLASILRRRFRQTDTIGRTGGDEFGILLQDLRPDEAAGLMERIRAEFGAVSHVDADAVPFRAAFSAGVASFVPGVDSREWTARAEAALSEARSNGGNRVVSRESAR